MKKLRLLLVFFLVLIFFLGEFSLLSWAWQPYLKKRSEFTLWCSKQDGEIQIVANGKMADVWCVDQTSRRKLSKLDKWPN